MLLRKVSLEQSRATVTSDFERHLTNNKRLKSVSKLPKMTAGRIRDFQRDVIAFYRANGRKFYWRTNLLSPWQWLVLELLLKRTRAEAVQGFFPSFIRTYHKPGVVCDASPGKLRSDLEQLGLGRQRCAALKTIAARLLEDFDGRPPAEETSLLSIPHVGLYISHAVLCFGYGQRWPVVDSNVARVLSRVYGLPLPRDAREKWIWDIAELVLPNKDCRDYNYGLLDIGATVCKSRAPECPRCYLRTICTYSRGEMKRRHIARPR